MAKSQNRLIATLRKREGEEVRIELCDYRGAHFLGIRVWLTDDAGNQVPTEKGLTVPLRMAEPLMHAIGSTLSEARGAASQAELFTSNRHRA